MSARAGHARVAGLIIAIMATFILCDLRKNQAYEAALAASAPAVALVKRMDPGDCFTTPKQARCLQLELEIHREGMAPYIASLTHVVDIEWMSRVQPGAWLTVGVSREDPKAVYFNEAAMAVAAPAPPAQ